MASMNPTMEDAKTWASIGVHRTGQRDPHRGVASIGPLRIGGFADRKGPTDTAEPGRPVHGFSPSA